MARLKVLISGAGIAGCTLAYWLARNGHSATVVERSGSLRSSGSPVDVRGPAADVAERMNIATRLREASIRVAGMTFFNFAGRQVARVDLETLRSSIAPKDIELARGDLAESFTRPAPTTPSTSSRILSELSPRTIWVWTWCSRIRARVASISSSAQTDCIRSSAVWHLVLTLNSSGMPDFMSRRCRSPTTPIPGARCSCSICRESWRHSTRPGRSGRLLRFLASGDSRVRLHGPRPAQSSSREKNSPVSAGECRGFSTP